MSRAWFQGSLWPLYWGLGPSDVVPLLAAVWLPWSKFLCFMGSSLGDKGTNVLPHS